MPVKKDASGKRWVEMEFITPGTPEQVWAAMATGPGNTAWFTRATIDGRVGGELKFQFGSEVGSSGEVTAWEPPKLFGYVERGWAEGAPPVATEITITGRAGNKCVVRMVHSLFASTDDWDDQLEGFESGWSGFFDVLRTYLAHFAGMKAASFWATTAIPGDQTEIYKRFVAALGLAGANVGEKRTMNGPQPASGVIERVHQDQRQRLLVLRIEAPGPGIALLGTYNMGERVNVGGTVYFYGDDADERVAAIEPKWRGWLSETFPPG